MARARLGRGGPWFPPARIVAGGIPAIQAFRAGTGALKVLDDLERVKGIWRPGGPGVPPRKGGGFPR